MKFIGIIPARYGSTRFPGKPLAMIGGKTMIQRVYEQAAKALEEVWVATDDQRIMEDVISWGGCAAMTSNDCTNGTDRCAEVVEQMTDLEADDVVINIQGDEPFIDPQHIGDLMDSFKEGVNIATLVGELNKEDWHNPNCVKVALNARRKEYGMKDYAAKFSRKMLINTTSDVYTIYRHIGVYGYRVKTLLELAALTSPPNEDNLEQVRWMDAGYKIKCVSVNYKGISVDTPEDLTKANRYLTRDKVADIFTREATAILQIPTDKGYMEAVNWIYIQVHKKGGKLITSGMGKAGRVAHHIATTFSSTGTPAVFLHPSEAQHGDLGVLKPNDILLLISNSGETRELIELFDLKNDLYPIIPTILITAHPDTPLAQQVSYCISTGNPDEVCPLGLTPTTSTTVMTVIGDALVVLMMERIGFTKEQYALRHHGGYIGNKLRDDTEQSSKNNDA